MFSIGELSKLSPVEGREHALKGQAVVGKLERLGKPVIAAINGYALGGGCELALACTIRIASENARFGQPEVKLGIIPGYGGSQRLARVVGEGRAMQLCLTAEQIDAAEAHRIGLVNKVVPAGQALAAAKEMAKAILANGPVACRYVLEAVRRGLDMPLSEGLVFEATAVRAVVCESVGPYGRRCPVRVLAPEARGHRVAGRAGGRAPNAGYRAPTLIAGLVVLCAPDQAFWGSHRSDELCSTAACQPPLPGNLGRCRRGDVMLIARFDGDVDADR